MNAKKKYIYRILREYSILVNYEGDVKRINVPSSVDDETFKQWQKRILGNEVTEVEVFVPFPFAPQTKMKNVKATADAKFFKRVISNLRRVQNSIRKADIINAEDSTVSRYTNFSKHALEGILDDLGNELEPSVVEFFQTFSRETDDDIDVKDFIRELIMSYNHVVKVVRKNIVT